MAMCCVGRAQRRLWYCSALLVALMLAPLLGGCSAQNPFGGGDTLSGSISAVGSTALYPLVAQASQVFMRAHHNTHIHVGLGGSLAGIQAVARHTVTIGDSDVYADPALYPDPTLTDHLVAVIPFTMIVNPSVTGITSLTQDQLIGMYSTGIYTNWRQLGGPNLPIVPVIRPITSGTRLTFRTYVMGGRDEIDVNHHGISLKKDSSQAVLAAVAKTPGAIGYLGLSVLNSSVKAISLDGVAAAPQAIEDGRYPFWGYEHMYTLGSGSALTAAFLQFMLTPQVQALARQLQYIPIADMGLQGIGLSPGAPQVNAPSGSEWGALGNVESIFWRKDWRIS